VTAPVEAWRRRGRYLPLLGHEIFTLDLPCTGEQTGPPLLLLHGFPTCSFDWRHTVDTWTRQRRVLALDFLGFGLSAKPDEPYRLTEQADLAQAFVEHAGAGTVDLLSHDMGDTIGGELLARANDGTLPFEVRRRVLTNGSIYIAMADLRDAQQFLLALPDEKLDASLGRELFDTGFPEIFGPQTQPDQEELDAQWELLSRGEGDQLLPRTIRYIEQRRAHEERWTGAIETHPAPLRIIWGTEDPVAVLPMAHRLGQAVARADLHLLEGIGHFPMIEAPERFTALVDEFLTGPV